MTAAQKKRAAEIYPRVSFERGAVTRGFADILSSLDAERPPSPSSPLVLITDEKREYLEALRRSRLWRQQDESHRVAHIRVSSTLPRTFLNPLFPSNYLDREIRKDQANHHRETSCFSRNVSNAMGRLLCYCVQHNYRKRFRIKAPVGDERVHAEVAGIDRSLVDRSIEEMFTRRSFLSRLDLRGTMRRIWEKGFTTPLKGKADYRPAYAMG